MRALTFNQIGLNTINTAASCRFYDEVFGFANCGAQIGWGNVMNVQELPEGGQTLVWWMVGRHPRIQFEIFHHTDPLLRAQPKDWSPADHGWVRFGIAVSDYNGVMERLAKRGIKPIAGEVTTMNMRRAAIRDPYCGVVIEIWEDGKGLPVVVQSGRNEYDPLMMYVTRSVADIKAAKHFYENILKMPTAPLDLLHSERDEALWGLPGAKRDGFLVPGGNGYIEIVEYTSPKGKPQGADHLLSDQGIMNVGLFTRETKTIQEIIDRLDAEGNGPSWQTTGEGILGVYINRPDREIELFSCPENVEAAMGFTSYGKFGGGDFIKMTPRTAAKARK